MVRQNTYLLLLKICAFLVFIGRGWTHLFWDAPYRTFFWDEDLLKGVVEGLTDMSWQNYVTSPAVDQFIQNAIKGTGWFYMLCAVAVVLLKTDKGKEATFAWRNKFLGYLLLLGSALLVVLAMLYCKDNFFNIGQFFEYSIQFSVPIFLYLAVFRVERLGQLLLPMKIAIALTFVCHGLYAYGYYPRPGNYVDMTLAILGVQESVAHQFLLVAGVLDFLMAILIFIPRVEKWALLYMVVWGLLTALARIFANWYPEFPMDTFGFWLWETIYRLPHGLLPLLVYMVLKNGRTK